MTGTEGRDGGEGRGRPPLAFPVPPCDPLTMSGVATESAPSIVCHSAGRSLSGPGPASSAPVPAPAPAPFPAPFPAPARPRRRPRPGSQLGSQLPAQRWLSAPERRGGGSTRGGGGSQERTEVRLFAAVRQQSFSQRSDCNHLVSSLSAVLQAALRLLGTL